MATSSLEPGLYVERLDRPWTETPFPFQGFLIRDQAQIEELQRHCSFVYVDVQKSDGSAAERRVDTVVDAQRAVQTVPGAVPEAARVTFHAAARPASIAPAHAAARSYPRARSVEQEVAVAVRIHADAIHSARAMIVRLEEEGRLDVELARETVAPMMESVLRNPDALIWLTRIKDHDVHGYQHAVSCSIWGLAFARHLGLAQSAIYEVGLGCLLHDVGNTRVPLELLDKHGALTPEELAEVRAHVEHGVDILGPAREITPRILELVRYHHERFDGSGYPSGLKGEEIPTYAKIAGIVDSYDALVSPRPHAERLAPPAAVRAIYGWRGTLFQAEVVERFIQVVGAFPVGSVVELNTGAVGAVIAQNEELRLRPRLMLLLDPDKRALPRAQIVDLMYDEPWRDAREFWIDKHVAPGAYGIEPRELRL